MKILLTGASGFVGSHLLEGLLREGLQVRCLIRQTSALKRLERLPIEVALGDVTRPHTLPESLPGVDTVIHLVGIIQPRGGATFRKIHVEGTRHLLEAARAAGVRRFLYLSALGTRPQAPTEYFRTKWEAEELIRGSRLEYLIMRPSVIAGQGGGFVKSVADLTRLPVVPVIGSGRYLLQPIYVGDLAACILRALADHRLWNRVFEMGGPDRLSFDQVIDLVGASLGRRPLKIHLPVPAVRPLVAAMERLLPTPPVTADQIAMLLESNICSLDFASEFGVALTPFWEAIGFLRAGRPAPHRARPLAGPEGR